MALFFDMWFTDVPLLMRDIFLISGALGVMERCLLLTI